MDPHPAGYWTTNLYREKEHAPRPDAPYYDLRPDDARRFRVLREALLALDGLQEKVLYLGAAWKWVWEYSADGQPLVYLHPMRGSVSATLTIGPEEESQLTGNGHVSSYVLAAIRRGVVAGPMRWCWLDLPADGEIDEVITALHYRRGFARRAR
jgi:hypothetical protein